MNKRMKRIHDLAGEILAIIGRPEVIRGEARAAIKVCLETLPSHCEWPDSSDVEPPEPTL